MKYLLDTNILFSTVEQRTFKRSDLYITEDVAKECVSSPERILKIKVVGIQTLEMKKKHFEKVKEVLSKHGDNLALIRLYSGKGKADVMMLAYILAEKEKPETLFEEEYTLVTRDKTLTKVAKEYGIKCILNIPS